MSKRTGRKGKNANNKDKQTVASADKTEKMTTTFLELSTDIQDMKRAQLQKLCKQFGLKASGKVRINAKIHTCTLIYLDDQKRSVCLFDNTLLELL